MQSDIKEIADRADMIINGYALSRNVFEMERTVRDRILRRIKGNHEKRHQNLSRLP